MSDAYKIFKQIQEKEKEVQRYKSYEREDLIDEIIKLQQENTQLKEELKDENNYHEEASKWYKEAFDTTQENIKLKSVLKEIREYIKENIREDSEYENYMEMRKEKYNELLEIIDKGIGK